MPTPTQKTTALAKHGIKKVSDNLPEDHEVNCGHNLFVFFEEELMEMFFKKEPSPCNSLVIDRGDSS